MSDSTHSTQSGDEASVPPATGWLTLTRHESVQQMIDTLLDLPPYREFNQSELAEMANVSRASVNRHFGLLQTAGVIEMVEETTPPRYRFNEESPVSKAIIQVDGQMNRVLSQLPFEK